MLTINPIKRTQETVVVIDAANIAYRSIYSFPGILMKYDDKSFFNTGAIYGMLRLVFGVYEKYKASNIVLVLEGDKRNNPRFKNPHYKSKRITSTQKTIDITNELILCRNILTMMGCVVAVPQAGECDDGIANVVSRLKHKYKLLIASNDHDMSVLLDRNVSILKNNKNNAGYLSEFTHKQFIQENGFDPKYFSLMLAVAGDSSDSIPGIKGIGEAKAKIIIKQLLNSNTVINSNSIACIIQSMKLKSLIDVSDVKDQIDTWHGLTRIHSEYPVAIVINKEILNIKRIQQMFSYMQFNYFLNDFNKIINMCNHFYSTRDNLLTMLQD